MGNSTFDAKAYASYSTATAGVSRAARFTSRGLIDSLDPSKMKGPRESRDSAANPESTPIIVALDVTGSMGMIAEQIAKADLGTLFQAILDRKPVSDPHLMFMGIGDCACDSAPVQASQFEADNCIVEQLTGIYLEGGGGGNRTESYDAAWYMAARHTVHDAMDKRGRRGYLFTIGDEEAPAGISGDALKRFFGDAEASTLSSAQMLSEAQRMYNVFHVIVEEGSHARSYLPQVKSSWAAVLGQHVISLADHTALAETIVAAIQMAEGADLATASAGWGSKGAIVSRAVASLPKGTPRLMLGRA